MEESIFDDRALADLKRRKLIAPVEQFLEEEDRIAGLEQAIARIKSDYKTHRVLLDRIQEPEGLVLNLGRGFHLQYKQPVSGSENPYAPYFGIQFPEPFAWKADPFLIIKRDRNNFIVLAKPSFTEYMNGKSVLEVYSSQTPRNPSEKDNTKTNEWEETTRKLLVERAILYNAVRNPEEFDRNRRYYKYDHFARVDKTKPVKNPATECLEMAGCCTPYHLLTDLTAEDFLRFYRHAVKQCAREFERIENLQTRDYHNPLGQSQFRAFTRDFAGTKGVITKLAGFAKVPVDLSVLD
jgi:hypothetical protein